jgi:predicted phage-related endonuclease
MNAPDRTCFLGGSDTAAVIGVSPWKDAFTLYCEKIGEIPFDPEESRVQRRGRILERAIGQLYAEDSGRMVGFPGQQVKRNGTEDLLPAGVGVDYRRAQIDAWEHFEGNTWVPLEIKSSSEFTRGKWGPSGTDDCPTYYCTQVHWQIGLTGAPFGRLVALLGADDLRVYTIQRDEQVLKFLNDAAAEFWQRVLDRNPPPVDYQHPRAGESLAKLFRDVNATEILQASDSDRSWRDVMQEAAEEIKRYEAVRDGAKAHLLHRMANASVLNFGDGTMFERKVIKRAGFTVEPTEYISATVKKERKSNKAGASALAAIEDQTNV